MGSSTFTGKWVIANSFGMTLNAGTSTIIIPDASAMIAGAGFNYNNVSFTNTAGNSSMNSANANTFNNVSLQEMELSPVQIPTTV